MNEPMVCKVHNVAKCFTFKIHTKFNYKLHLQKFIFRSVVAAMIVRGFHSICMISISWKCWTIYQSSIYYYNRLYSLPYGRIANNWKKWFSTSFEFKVKTAPSTKASRLRMKSQRVFKKLIGNCKEVLSYQSTHWSINELYIKFQRMRTKKGLTKL